MVLQEVNWDPRNAVPVEEALEVLAKAVFEWTDDITAAVAADSLFLAVAVTLSTNAPASPVIRLRATAAIDGNTLIVSVLAEDLKAIENTIVELTSFAQFDIDCNQLRGPDKRAVSSSTAALYGGAEPFAPGGILRVAMVITREGAPVTFMRRPFANAPVSPVMPGVVLQPVVIG